MRKGFTLIELMIVVAIIAIIAAIAIPSLLRSRIAANETAAIGGLKQITSHEASWRQTEADGNGLKDYWTYDVTGFYAMADGEGNAVRYIDISFSNADTDADPSGIEATYYDATWAAPASSVSKSGYLYEAIDESTAVAGSAYKVNLIRPLGAATGNTSSYGYIAYPEDYASTGIRVFIVSEAGTVYGVDNGEASTVGDVTGEHLFLDTAVQGTQHWPANDPTTITGMATRNWGVAD